MGDGIRRSFSTYLSGLEILFTQPTLTAAVPAPALR